ncbi:MAG: response regulator [Planctomycetes bacterium]|nr:response regulator [Planctomycetota bacterium]
MIAIDEKVADVLLVEDNPAEARLLAEVIRGSPVRINPVLAMNGDEALAYLRRQGRHASARRPQLVLLDLNLPGRDGREILKEIKSDPELLRIPVVILTTSGSARDVARAYDAHANCFISKPSELDEYRRVLGSLIEFWLRIVKLPAD